MEVLLGFTIVVILYLASTLRAGNGGRGSINAMMWRLAKRYSARLQRGGLLSQPRIRFPYGQTACEISYSHERGGFVDVKCDWPDPSLTMELLIDNGARELGRTDGRYISGLTISDKFAVKSDQPQACRDLMSEEVQEAIRRWSEIVAGRGIYVLIQRGRLVLRNYFKPASYDQLLANVRAALGVHDAMRVATAFGIDWLGAGEIEAAVCKICGEELASQIVYCRSCHTPHHRDCWQYNGACSTYGCQESLFVTHTDRRNVELKPD